MEWTWQVSTIWLIMVALSSAGVTWIRADLRDYFMKRTRQGHSIEAPPGDCPRLTWSPIKTPSPAEPQPHTTTATAPDR